MESFYMIDYERTGIFTKLLTDFDLKRLTLHLNIIDADSFEESLSKEDKLVAQGDDGLQFTAIFREKQYNLDYTRRKGGAVIQRDFARLVRELSLTVGCCFTLRWMPDFVNRRLIIVPTDMMHTVVLDNFKLPFFRIGFIPDNVKFVGVGSIGENNSTIGDASNLFFGDKCFDENSGLEVVKFSDEHGFNSVRFDYCKVVVAPKFTTLWKTDLDIIKKSLKRGYPVIIVTNSGVSDRELANLVYHFADTCVKVVAVKSDTKLCLTEFSQWSRASNLGWKTRNYDVGFLSSAIFSNTRFTANSFSINKDYVI